MNLRGSFGGFYFVIASYGKIESSENGREIALCTQKAPKVRLIENLGLTPAATVASPTATAN